MTRDTHTYKSEDPEQDREIAEYLREHRDFFDRHTDVLAEMVVSCSSGATASLVERQVQALREKNKILQRRLKDLIDTARENETLYQQLHELSLTAGGQIDLQAAIDRLTEQIKSRFELDLVVMRMPELEQAEPSPESSSEDCAAYQDVRARVAHGQTVLDDRLPTRVLRYLFAADAEAVGSAALVPIGGPDPMGVLALASLDRRRFRTDLDTVFLDRLGAVVGVTVNRLLG